MPRDGVIARPDWPVENDPPPPIGMLAGSACGAEGGSPPTRKFLKIPEKTLRCLRALVGGRIAGLL